jgi:protein-S-isoprenylcysteine O-methyltransferase Ste14
MNWCTGRHMPLWLGIAFHFVGFPAVPGLLPWALSLLGARHGWASGRPGAWNVVGLVPVVAGFYIEYRCIHEHIAAAPSGWLLEKTRHYPTPSYLLTKGPYRYSCNPIYMAEAVIWLGWMGFYGSLVLVGIGALALVLGPLVVPREERGLEARFGEAYREYRRTTPRWFGKARR